MLVVIFDAEDYYGIMAEDYRFTIIGRTKEHQDNDQYLHLA